MLVFNLSSRVYQFLRGFSLFYLFLFLLKNVCTLIPNQNETVLKPRFMFFIAQVSLFQRGANEKCSHLEVFLNVSSKDCFARK